MTARGRTMRRLSMGPSVRPPANTAASSRSSASNPTVSATVAGRSPDAPPVVADAETVGRHLDVLPAAERPAYRALAERALDLSGRDDAPLRVLLEDAL